MCYYAEFWMGVVCPTLMNTLTFEILLVVKLSCRCDERMVQVQTRRWYSAGTRLGIGDVK